MSELMALLAAHPLQEEPYNAIRFVRVDGFGTPIYRVGDDPKEMGPPNALKAAFAMFGGRCFHCKKSMAAQSLSYDCTRDHLKPRKDGGERYLHNLVLACGSCNRGKGGADLISFNVERGAEYMAALEAHLSRCIRALGD